MFGNIYGLDLGTYEIKVYDKKKNAIWREKNTIAIANEDEIFSVGDEAYEMFEKAPDNIEVVFPMKEGVISHFYDMQYLLNNLLKKERHFARSSKYIVAVPTDVTEVEKKAFFDLVVHSTAKAKEVNVVERAVADAIGIGLDIQNSPGIFIANFGGETTELSVLASGGMVLNKLVKTGGAMLDNAISSLVRHTTDFLIGRLTAEKLRQHFDVFDEKTDTSMEVAGRDLITGVPQQKEISVNLVRAAVKEPLAACIREIDLLLERTPPEVRKSIEMNGIYVTGGLAHMKGLAEYIEGRTGIKAQAVKNPDVCVVEGLKQIIQSKELRKLTFSMLDENYRWMG